MAVDNLETEWHITPDGWVSGTSTFFGKPSGPIVEKPENTMETWIAKLYQQSGYSREERSWFISWKDESIPQEERDRTRGKYPKPVSY